MTHSPRTISSLLPHEGGTEQLEISGRFFNRKQEDLIRFKFWKGHLNELTDLSEREGWRARKSSIKVLADLVSNENKPPGLPTAASLPYISTCHREVSCLILFNIYLFVYLFCCVGS